MAECIRMIGSAGHVLSLVTPADPDGARPSADAAPALGCLLVNAGVIHRVGPHRINVKIARHLAQRSIPSIRMDLSGRGDTPAAKVTLPLAEQAVQDVRAGMDELTRLYGCQQFVMFGICSGAVVAMDAAFVDARIVGVCLLDGYAYQTRRTHWIRYLRAVFSRPLSMVAASLIKRLQSHPQADADTAGLPSGPANLGIGDIPQADYVRILDTITARGARGLVIYTGSVGARYNYAGQFRDVFGAVPFKGLVRCDYMPHIDHTLTSQASQRILLDCLSDWIAREVLPNLPARRP